MHTSFFQIGRLHIPIFGVFAALGVMAAPGLSQRTARYAGLSEDAVWNASVTCVVALFAISRLLLVLFNWHSFLRYPLQLLAVPSLSALGVLLTWTFMLGYLRVGGVPLLAFLDAMAPYAALMWAFLSAGRFADGTRDGMPMSGWLGGDDRVHPVEAYTFIAALALWLVLLRRLKRRSRVGGTAGVGLVLAGVAVYFIDFFRLPSDLLPSALLDPSQVLAIIMICAGVIMALPHTSKRSTTPEATVQREGSMEDHHAV